MSRTAAFLAASILLVACGVTASPDPVEPSGEEWAEHVACMPPSRADAPFELHLVVPHTLDCDEATAYVDAVEVVADDERCG